MVPAAPPAIAPDDASPTMRVVIVSDNSETLDGLQEYLQRAGIAAHGTRHLVGSRIEPSMEAVVVFPDDFGTSDVIALVVRLVRARERIRCLLVTRDPRGLQALLASTGIDDACLARTIVIAKPAWGWTILDGLRTRLET